MEGVWLRSLFMGFGCITGGGLLYVFPSLEVGLWRRLELTNLQDLWYWT